MLEFLIPMALVAFLGVIWACLVAAGRADRQLEAQRPFNLATLWREEL